MNNLNINVGFIKSLLSVMCPHLGNFSCGRDGRQALTQDQVLFANFKQSLIASSFSQHRKIPQCLNDFCSYN